VLLHINQLYLFSKRVACHCTLSQVTLNSAIVITVYLNSYVAGSTVHHHIPQNHTQKLALLSTTYLNPHVKYNALHHIPQPTCQVQRCPSLYTTKLCTARHPVPQAIYVNPSKAYNHIPQSHICLFQQCVFTTCHNKATCQWQHCI